jgi:hypothetical protein
VRLGWTGGRFGTAVAVAVVVSVADADIAVAVAVAAVVPQGDARPKPAGSA